MQAYGLACRRRHDALLRASSASSAAAALAFVTRDGYLRKEKNVGRCLYVQIADLASQIVVGLFNSQAVSRESLVEICDCV